VLGDMGDVVEITDPTAATSEQPRPGGSTLVRGRSGGGIWQLILVVLVTAAALWLLGHMTVLLRCLGSAPLHRQVLARRRFTQLG
jgi:hypothetical protein